MASCASLSDVGSMVRLKFTPHGFERGASPLFTNSRSIKTCTHPGCATEGVGDSVNISE